MYDTDKAREIAHETFAEAKEAFEQGVRTAVPALLKAATIGVVAYLAAKATQRAIQTGFVVAMFGIGAHFFSVAPGLSGGAFMTTALWHVGGLAALFRAFGYELPVIGAWIIVPGVSLAAVTAYWATLAAAGVLPTLGLVGFMLGGLWLIGAVGVAERYGRLP